MNARQLIEKLQQLDPESEVVYEDDIAFYPVTEVVQKDVYIGGPYSDSFWYMPFDMDQGGPVTKVLLV